ncbi:MAG: ABC transporter permease [Lachnospiraceae bacterium]|nr:ABC transporter permease [Lachnospiraceae bacterium]
MWRIPFKNLIKKPLRTLGLLTLAVISALTFFGGTLVLRSLEGGIKSLSSRLGADYIIVPEEEEAELENILLQGVPGYFYMDRQLTDKIAAVDGVGQISSQYYLATADSGCCSIPVQIIGFDPETDFSIQPWIRTRYEKEIRTGDILVGADFSLDSEREMRFYGVTCRVAAQLEETGTSLDRAVYANQDTVRILMQAAVEKGFVHLGERNPENLVSSILVRQEKGADTKRILKELQNCSEEIQVVKTDTMISGIADKLSGIAVIIRSQTILIWILSFLIMAAASVMTVGERRKEFAILRMLGATGTKLAGMVLGEAAVIGAAGGLAGVILGGVVFFLFGGLLEEKLGLPYLLPPFGQMTLLGLLTLAVTIFIVPLTQALAAFKACRAEASLVLREGE